MKNHMKIGVACAVILLCVLFTGCEVEYHHRCPYDTCDGLYYACYDNPCSHYHYYHYIEGGYITTYTPNRYDIHYHACGY